MIRWCRPLLLASALGVGACASTDSSTETPANTDTNTDTNAVSDTTAVAEIEPDSADGDAGNDVAVAEETSGTHPPVITRTDDAVGIEPTGVGTVTVRVTAADGSVCDVCMWLASAPDQRNQGLMEVDDLGEPVGMVFSWVEPTSGNFFMFNTPTPLSIAWFEPGGDFLSQTDMEPCITDDSVTCERYGSGGTFDLAIEMFQGELGVVGIGPGSHVELLAGTESPVCLV